LGAGKSNTMIRYITKDRLDSYWNLVANYINESIDRGELSINDVRQKLEDETMGLLVVSDRGEIKAGCVVEFVKYAQNTALRVVALGGVKMKEWLDDLIDFLDKWAMEQHVFRIEQAGRKGWIKVLEKYGYTQKYAVMTKDFSYG
jgi:hypothetical protein